MVFPTRLHLLFIKLEIALIHTARLCLITNDQNQFKNGGCALDFLILLFAHLVADYPLQGAFLADMKGKNFLLLCTHAGIWTGTILIAAHLIGYSVDLLDVFILFSVHAVADFMKARPIGFYKKLNPLGWGLAIDQLIHVVQILVFLFFMSEKIS